MRLDERRGDVRYEKTISIRYNGRGGFRGYGYAETQDVSRRGLRFFCDRFLPRELQLDVEVDMGSVRIFIRGARVVRAVKVPHAETFSIGIEFDDLSPAESRQLVECGDASTIRTRLA